MAASTRRLGEVKYPRPRRDSSGIVVRDVLPDANHILAEAVIAAVEEELVIPHGAGDGIVAPDKIAPEFDVGCFGEPVGRWASVRRGDNAARRFHCKWQGVGINFR